MQKNIYFQSGGKVSLVWSATSKASVLCLSFKMILCQSESRIKTPWLSIYFINADQGQFNDKLDHA